MNKTHLIALAAGVALGYFFAGKLVSSSTTLAQVYTFGSGLH